MTPSEGERLAAIETRLEDVLTVIGEFKDLTKSVTQHTERIDQLQCFTKDINRRLWWVVTGMVALTALGVALGSYFKS